MTNYHLNEYWEVTIRLRPETREDAYSWACTIDGERKIVTRPTVRVTRESYEKALECFNPSEILGVNLKHVGEPQIAQVHTIDL